MPMRPCRRGGTCLAGPGGAEQRWRRPIASPPICNSIRHSRVFFNVPQIPTLSYKLRYVARNLRYLPLPQLVGEAVTLRSLRTACDDVIRQIGPKLPGLTVTPIHDVLHIETQFSKYAFWDSCWQVDGEAAWNPEIKGLPLLSSLGYFTTGDAAAEWNEFAGDFDFYDGLREEIEQGRLYLRLFLVADAKPVRHRDWPRWLSPIHSALSHLEALLLPRLRWSRPRWSLPRRYFPQRCVITDAALTNLQGCWMARHMYG